MQYVTVIIRDADGFHNWLADQLPVHQVGLKPFRIGHLLIAVADSDQARAISQFR